MSDQADRSIAVVMVVLLVGVALVTCYAIYSERVITVAMVDRGYHWQAAGWQR